MSTERATTVAAQRAEANLFDIDAPFAVHYSSSSIKGQPLLSYRDTERDVSFSGEEIVRTRTAVGELVTITVAQVPDAFVRTFTLVVPTVVVERGEVAEFSTLGIETIDRSVAFVGPPGPAGVQQTYSLHELSGTAQFVEF